MSSATPLDRSSRQLVIARILAAVIAVVVLADVAAVKAPGLALLAVPFLAGAIAMRHGGRVASALLLLWALLYVSLGANFIVTNVFGASTPGGETPNAMDFVFALVGTPFAAALSYLLIVRLAHLLRSPRVGGAAGVS